VTTSIKTELGKVNNTKFSLDVDKFQN